MQIRLLLNCIEVEYTEIHARSINTWMPLLLEDEISSPISWLRYAMGMAGPRSDCSVTSAEKQFYSFPVLRALHNFVSPTE